MKYQYKISMAQIDPNGLCNVGCWFCPVRYAENPLAQRTNMPIDVFENIIDQKNQPIITKSIFALFRTFWKFSVFKGI